MVQHFECQNTNFHDGLNTILPNVDTTHGKSHPKKFKLSQTRQHPTVMLYYEIVTHQRLKETWVAIGGS